MAVCCTFHQHRRAAQLHCHGKSRSIRRQCKALGQIGGKSIAARIGSRLWVLLAGPAVQRNRFDAVPCGSSNFCREQGRNIAKEGWGFLTGARQGKHAVFRVNDLQFIHPAPRRNLGQAAQLTHVGTG